MPQAIELDVVVVGAGVIGAAVARRAADAGQSVAVLEKFERVAEGITSRNSGVVHSGIYYPPSSLKARLCVRGKELLYEYARARAVPHAMVGKAIVALGSDEEERLESLLANARASGATGLARWSRGELEARLPGVKGDAAVFASETGIVDPFALTSALLAEAEGKGALVLTSAGARSIEQVPGGYALKTARGPVRAAAVVNAAGLFSDEVALMAGVGKYKIHPCRGDYFRLRPTCRYKHLIYPVKGKQDAGLGIHLTLDLDGGYRLGPDTEYVDGKNDYSPREDKLESFRKAAEKLFGPIDSSQLSYDQCGIRPKLRAPSDPVELDFVIAEDLPRFVNLVGIESPGLTASLAVAEEVGARLGF